MKPLEPCAHPLRLYRSDTHPEQVYFLGECRRIGKDTVVIGLGIHLAVSEHAARSTESTNVRKEIEMIQRDLERLHASHGKARHRAVIAVRNRSVCFVNEWNQRLC